MRFLLDTHTFIWWGTDPAKLSRHVYTLCGDRSNTMVLSVASAWEIQIKIQIGKLRLTVPLADMIEGQRQTNKMEILPVTLLHVLALPSLPPHHKDPFDRIIIGQALTEHLPLASADRTFTAYPITVVW